uniref:Peptidase S58 DmpA n=1 Tax=Variovorax paradoxus (strain S110) TaxID=543728 RepID=C5D0U9_VARPS
MPPPTAQTRARDLGLRFPGKTGPANAITDIPGVEVGQTTLIHGDGALHVGAGPVRTGVTIVLPRGRSGVLQPVKSGVYALNGNGEMTGTHWIEEAGIFRGPIGLTNTHSIGMVHHALVRWLTRVDGDRGAYPWLMPVVAETCDAMLNDMDGLHVEESHVLEAIAAAAPGAVAEGSVGGGTGMVCYGFKGGTGTASRIVGVAGQDYRVGVLVQANMGIRPWLSVLGVPVGECMPGPGGQHNEPAAREQGSIIVVVATDAPLLSSQLKRLARRAALGVGRTGTPGGDGSGDIMLAFSTHSDQAPGDHGVCRTEYLAQHTLDPLFLGVVEAVEESILNALVAARTMVGRNNTRVEALDHSMLVDLMRRHGRLAETR